jgi:hypothetical protein
VAYEVDHEAGLRCCLLVQDTLLAEVGVVAGDPILAGWGEDVEVDGVFEGLGGVGKVGGDDEDFAGADDFFYGRGFVAEEEAEGAFGDVGDLLVGVLMAGNEAAFLEDDAGEHGLLARDELAGEERVELFGRDVGPAGVERFNGHRKRIVLRGRRELGL